MRTHLIGVLVVALSCSALAQHNTRKSGASRTQTAANAAVSGDPVSISTIVFQAPAGFSETDLKAASGLSTGLLTRTQMQQAADKLTASGQFQNVSFAVTGNTVTYKVKPQPEYLPVRFENFAWFTDAELLRATHAKCPLFLGSLAGKGSVADAVQAELTRMVREQAGAKANVVTAEETGPDGKATAIVYRITGVDVRISRVRILNTPLDAAGATADITRGLQDKPYNREQDRDLLASKLSEAYGDLGYVNFKLTDFETAAPHNEGDHWDVELDAKAVPGNQYRIGTVQWKGDKEITADEFKQLCTLHEGDVAERSHLDAMVKMISRKYEHDGFVNAHVNATPVFHPEKQTVDYTFSVDRGTRFATQLD